jgi:hypothetical protein
LVGAIKLNKEEAFLASQALCGSLGLDEALWWPIIVMNNIFVVTLMAM